MGDCFAEVGYMYRRLFTNGMVNLLNFGTNILVNLALTPILIHQLGEETYGLWLFVVSLSVTKGAFGFFDLGVSSALVKFIAEYEAVGAHQKEYEATSAALLVQMLIGGASAALLWGIAFFGSDALAHLFNIPTHLIPQIAPLLYVLGLQVWLEFLGYNLSAVLEGWQRYDITRGLNIVRLVVYTVVVSIFLWNGAGVLGVSLATLISEAVRQLGHLVALRRLRTDFRLTRHISWAVVGDMFSLSSRAILTTVLDTLYNQMDKIIISIWLSTTFLTFYDISARLHLLVFALTTIIGPLVVPIASVLSAKDQHDELGVLFIRTSRYSALLTAPTALIVIVLAEPLTRFWVGEAYLSTVPATRCFISYLLLWPLMRIGMNMLIGMNKMNQVLIIQGIGTLVNLCASLLLVSSFGVIGVIWGTVIGHSVSFLPALLIFKQAFHLRWAEIGQGVVMRVYPFAFLSAGLVVALTACIPITQLYQVVVCGALGMSCFGLLFICFALPTDERAQLISLLQSWKTRLSHS